MTYGTLHLFISNDYHYLFFQVRTSKLYATVDRSLVWISLTFMYIHLRTLVCSYIHCKEEKLFGSFRNAWSHVVLASSITFLDPFLDIALCPLTCPILLFLSMWDKDKVYPYKGRVCPVIIFFSYLRIFLSGCHIYPTQWR